MRSSVVNNGIITKKKLLFLFSFFILLICISPLRGQTSWSWPKKISHGVNPDFDIDRSTGTIHLVTVKDGMGVIYNQLDMQGNELLEEIIPNTEYEHGTVHHGPAISVDPDGVPHVCFRIEQGSYTYVYNIYYTYREGGTWSAPLLVQRDVPYGFIVKMASDGAGTIHVVNSQYSDQLSAIYGKEHADVIYYRISQNLIQKHSFLTDPNTLMYRLDSRFDIDVTPDNNIHVVLANPDQPDSKRDSRVLYFRSENGGNDWQNMGDIASSHSLERNGCPDIFADTLNKVHFMYGTSNDDEIGRHPSVRYARFWKNWKEFDKAATKAGDISEDWGYGSVAASDDGQYVVVIFLKKHGYGALYATLSSDAGQHWEEPVQIASSTVLLEHYGRNLPLVRAWRNNFVIAYPTAYGGTYVRYLRDVGDLPPTARAGGPYTGKEGSPVRFSASQSFDSGQNPGLVEYSWDWQADGVFDTTLTADTLYHSFPDDFTGYAILQIEDRVGNLAYDTTSVTISNVPPLPTITAPRSVNEGESFNFNLSIADPGSEDSHSADWDLGDGTHSTEISSFSHSYLDEGSGQYLASVTVEDDDGGAAVDTFMIRVHNLPPVANGNGPYHIPPKDTLLLVGTGTDPGASDILQSSWELDGDGLVYDVFNDSAKVAYPVTGNYTVFFKVEDGDGGWDVDTVQIAVNNTPPTISQIPEQTIREGGTFQSLELKNYVSDQEQDNDEISWSYFGNIDLTVQLNGSVLHVAVPDSEWSGIETITVVATDPMDLSDSAGIEFRVQAVNDPPLWKSSSLTYIIDEDSTLLLPISYFSNLVTDVDNSIDELAFTLDQNVHTHGQMVSQPSGWIFYADPNWNGTEKVHWIVSDPGGRSAVVNLTLIFNAEDDPPEPFSLISPMDFDSTAWPDSIVFRWEASSDVDSLDQISYKLLIRPPVMGAGYQFQSQELLDTTYVWKRESQIAPGVYYWLVTALDLSGDEVESTNHGTLRIKDTSGIDDGKQMLPSELQLLQNHPNPFNPGTKITYHLPQSGEVTLLVFNMLGQEVRVLARERREPGVYTVSWDGRDEHGLDVPSGIYFCRLQAGEKILMRKMMLVR